MAQTGLHPVDQQLGPQLNPIHWWPHLVNGVDDLDDDVMHLMVQTGGTLIS